MENKQNFKLIAHALVKVNDKYLLIKRTPIKRGKPNSLPEYWDIPGGMVEEGETPSVAAIRETKEEVNEKMKSDWYVSAQEGVERGIYDGIISSIDELI